MEPMTRGYAAPLSARFILEDEIVGAGVRPETLEHIRRIAEAKPEIWVPRAEVMYLWRVIDEASADEAAAYNNLVRCGESVADEAIGGFLKLLLRILSPKQFARKFPDIWEHEHRGGHVEAILGENNTMFIDIHDVEGFAHVGPIGTGFVGTALRAIGLKDLKVRDITWTRARPDANDIRIDISWR